MREGHQILQVTDEVVCSDFLRVRLEYRVMVQLLPWLFHARSGLSQQQGAQAPPPPIGRTIRWRLPKKYGSRSRRSKRPLRSPPHGLLPPALLPLQLRLLRSIRRGRVPIVLSGLNPLKQCHTGSTHDAYRHIRALLQPAKHEVFIIDPYMDETIYLTLATVTASPLATNQHLRRRRGGAGDVRARSDAEGKGPAGARRPADSRPDLPWTFWYGCNTRFWYVSC